MLLAFAISATPASADTFFGSFRDENGGSGSGTLQATYSPAIDPVGYHIDSISGIAYGQPVTLSDYDFVDNYFFYPAVAQVNVIGFSFATSPTQAYNIYEDFGILSSFESPYACGGVPYCIIVGNPDNSGVFPDVTDPILKLTSLSIAPVPGPLVDAGLPGLVMAFGGLVAWRRRRNEAAVV